MSKVSVLVEGDYLHQTSIFTVIMSSFSLPDEEKHPNIMIVLHVYVFVVLLFCHAPSTFD